jgi:aspartate 1-decarboxylase
MQITLLKSKLQEVIVTEANINYRGSITIDQDLMDAANMKKFELVHVNNASNGSRIITYIIPGERGSGEICLNGAAAVHFEVGQKVHILSYAAFEYDEADDYEPIVVLTDVNNKVLEYSNY